MSRKHEFPMSSASERLALMALLGMFLLEFSGYCLAAVEVKVGGTGSALATVQKLADVFSKQDPQIKITVMPSLGSGGAIKAVIKSGIDIALSSRRLTADERNLGAAETEYARSPFVFAVAATSTASAITTAQLADIYAGKIRNWPDGSPIRVVLRPAGDTDTDLVKSMSPMIRQALTEAEMRPGVAFSLSDQDAADDIERIPGALGPVTLALIVAEKRPLKALKLDGVEPTVRNAVSGRYAYRKTFYFVTNAKPSPATQRFAAFIQSKTAHEILARNGHWVP